MQEEGYGNGAKSDKQRKATERYAKYKPSDQPECVGLAKGGTRALGATTEAEAL